MTHEKKTCSILKSQHAITHSLTWGLDVDRAHGQRLLELIRADGVCHAELIPPSAPTRRSEAEGGAILMVSENCVAKGLLPLETLKYINRVFHVPFSCNSIEWLQFHPLLQSLVNKNNNSEVEEYVIKVQASPKSMTEPLLQFVSGFTKCPYSSNEYTHLLQCIFVPLDGTFRWGLSTREEADAQQLTNVKIVEKLSEVAASRGFAPVSRAFYKMKEIIEKYSVAWGWTWAPNQIAVDVGASPGGWTQYLAHSGICKEVVAVDAGLLHSDVLDLKQCIYVKGLIQSDEAKNALKSQSQQISIVVCDINADPCSSAQLLCEHVFPYVSPRNCIVVLTLKLHKNPKPKMITALEKRVQEILAPFGATDFKVIHLTSNSRNERTLCCRLLN